MNKRFAIFDMDGTLVDSMVFWERLGREYLASKGITEGIERVLEQIIPMTMSESSALFIKAFGIPGTPESVAAEMNAMMEEHYRTDIPLKTGVEEYLAQLSQNGVIMCVASSTAKDLMYACLSRLGVADRFAFLLSCEEVGAGKNRPDVYWEAARRLRAKPWEIAVYEDALYAARTAKEAGFYTVAVFDDSEKDQWDELTNLAHEVILDWNKAAQDL